ncbi:MAG: helicase-related protein, partial [Planctomycetes bacterium]|nr:helicase-related protein [Planctomycetota bacterium]
MLTEDDPGDIGEHLVNRDKLDIFDVLDQLAKRDSFFLIASTGLGKTVIVPLFLLMREMRYQQTDQPERAKAGPRIWVVEPKIAIAQSLHQVMNLWWSEHVSEARPVLKGFNLFGCKTKVDHRDLDAPIMFITTGIFSIYARKGLFEPGRDLVLIDEAHVTLETDEALELGIGICRRRGVALNYMSATVDATDIPQRLGARVVKAEKRRFPVWKHNLRQPIDQILVDLVERTLVNPEEAEELFPKKDDEAWRSVRDAVLERDRAKGMLVVVNSYTANDSDAKRLERMLLETPFADKIAVRTLAGEVLRDPKRRAAYEADLKRWKEQKVRYVLIATSVVEMGVTLPDLDFVVSMDSALEEVENGVRLGPLGTNALIQRIGRVGRERPGIAYISRDIGAPYSLFSDEELNEVDALEPEPIRWPTERGNLEWLAYYSFDQEWDSLDLLKRLREL